MTFYSDLKAWLVGACGGEPLGVWGMLLCGSAAGVTAQSVCYPLDTVRHRMQANGIGGSPRVYRSAMDCAAKMWAQEGVRSFFKGWGLNCFRALPGAVPRGPTRSRTIPHVLCDPVRHRTIPVRHDPAPHRGTVRSYTIPHVTGRHRTAPYDPARFSSGDCGPARRGKQPVAGAPRGCLWPAQRTMWPAPAQPGADALAVGAGAQARPCSSQHMTSCPSCWLRSDRAHTQKPHL